ncbi:urea transporter [Lutibacter citreus]|uniref:urea transporter n=1 Tax=Lutibacter citreus TaxID=2138210 RepID=UPI000DBE17FA|nr:urea transporter [Lutibacter citreus]
MKNKLKKKAIFISESILTSYSQIFFTENKVLALILFVVSFTNWWIGLSGFIAVVTALVFAELLEYAPVTIQKGLFSFNSLLVGLGIGTYFSPGIEVLLLIIIGSIVAFFCTIFIKGILEKYGLPFLSFPFLLGMWLMLLSFPIFSNISLNSEALYPSNMFFKIGGSSLIVVIDSLTKFFDGTGLYTYFLSLGAIFFQFNIVAGILIAIGLLIHSRVHFLFSLIGFFVAYWFYSFLGVYTGSLNYTYYGFNFILSAIAIGGYYLIPSRKSLIWSVILIPVLVIVTVGSDRLFSYFELSVFSLPFNIVIIGMLYAFKIRYNQTREPILTFIQQKNPETNAYIYNSQSSKKYSVFLLPIRLPFIGKWIVNQAHDGVYTHKDFFKYAWDFIIKDPNTNKEFINEGFLKEDYYCFNKPVIAPASGTIVAIENSIQDNEIGVANTVNNWGNTVVIKHYDYLYSKLCHLKNGSVAVKVGETIEEGHVIGKCGNSGRSPYPHLHFQLQSTGKIGASTIFWPLSEYLISQKNTLKFKQKGVPEINDVVENIQVSPILKGAFQWSPGDLFKLEMVSDNGNKTLNSIKNEIDINNKSFLHCLNTGAKLYYENNGKTFLALNYLGSKNSLLYYFFYTFYKVVLSNTGNLNVESKFPIHHLYRFPIITLQDFLVPFGIFLKGNYRLLYKETSQVFSPKELELNSNITGIKNRIFSSSKIVIEKNGRITIRYITSKNKTLQLRWENNLD